MLFLDVYALRAVWSWSGGFILVGWAHSWDSIPQKFLAIKTCFCWRLSRHIYRGIVFLTVIRNHLLWFVVKYLKWQWTISSQGAEWPWNDQAFSFYKFVPNTLIGFKTLSCIKQRLNFLKTGLNVSFEILAENQKLFLVTFFVLTNYTLILIQ